MAVNQISGDTDQSRQDKGDWPESHQPSNRESLLGRDEKQRADGDQADSEQQCRNAFRHLDQ